MTKVLVVDDVEDNIILLTLELEDGGFQVIPARSGYECIEECDKDAPDIILLDNHMPGMSGIEALEKLKANPVTAEIPVLMVSADFSHQQVVKALDLGAHDFVSKPIDYPVLAARMRSALRLVNAREALIKANAELEHLATRDSLTGAYNRRQFFVLADVEMSKARRQARDLSVLMIDIDYFKVINDQHGHAAGDHALLEITERINAAGRASDIVARLGGEEFAVCCPDTDLVGAKTIAERIRERCKDEPIICFGKELCITVSIGLSQLDPLDAGFDALLQRADKMLYKAKESGRNRSVAG